MRTLILGANGMLGHALVRVFGADAIPWDRDDLDITDAAAVTKKLGELRPDVVINAAAYTAVDKAESEPDIAMKVNGEAVSYLARACKALAIPLLHISTDYVFEGNQPGGYTEDAVPDSSKILNVYGRSKRRGEELLEKSGASSWLVRTAWLYGPHGKNFVATILGLAETKPELRVVADQHGSPTYTDDLAKAIHALIRDKASYGTYHLVNDGIATWADLAAEACKIAEITTTIIRIPATEYPLPARRPEWSVLRNTKRPPLRPWKEAVRDYVQSLRTSDTLIS